MVSDQQVVLNPGPNLDLTCFIHLRCCSLSGQALGPDQEQGSTDLCFPRWLSICAISPGDHVAGMLAVAVASSRTLEVLDLEGTGLTNQSAQVRSHYVLKTS